MGMCKMCPNLALAVYAYMDKEKGCQTLESYFLSDKLFHSNGHFSLKETLLVNINFLM